MGNSVLERHAEELILVVPLEGFGEEAGDPLISLLLPVPGDPWQKPKSG